MRKLLLIIMIGLCCSINAQTISEQLTTISNTKAAIKASLESKGVSTTGIDFVDYDNLIDGIVQPATATVLSGYCAETIAVGNLVKLDEYFAIQSYALATPPSALIYSCALAANGSAVYFGGATTNHNVYRLLNGRYQKVTFDSIQTGTGFGAAITSDGGRIVVGSNSAAKIQSFAWDSGDNRYEVTAAISGNIPTNSAFRLGMSADGSKLASSNGYDTGSVRRLYSYVWSAGNNRYEETAAPDTEPDDRTYGCAMSGDGNFLAVADVTASPYLYTYQWDSGDSRYELTTAPDEDIVSYGSDIAISNDGTYLAVAMTGSPYLKTYTWNSGANQYKVTSAPDVLPSGTARGISMTSDGSMICVGSNGATDNITTYLWSSDNNRYEITASASLTLFADIRDTAMTFDGKSIAIGHAGPTYATMFITDTPNNSNQISIYPNIIATESISGGLSQENGILGDEINITGMWWQE